MHGERNGGQACRSGGAQPFADGNAVVDGEVQRNRLAAVLLEDFAVGREQEVRIHLGAGCGVAAVGFNAEALGRRSLHAQMQAHGERGGVESRTEIGGGGRQNEFEIPWRHHFTFSRTRMTLSTSASRTCGGRRRRAESSDNGRFNPERWKSSV